MNTAEVSLEEKLESLDRKLDFVVSQMKEYERKQREIQELKEDMSMIVRDLFQTASVELDEVAQNFDTRDLLHLLKKLMRNVRNLNSMLDQLESTRDLVKDAAPLGKILFDETLHKLEELDKKGYFAFLREVSQLVDTVVTSFSADDVKLLRENIVQILLTVKSITQPEMLDLVKNATSFFEKMSIVPADNVTYLSLLKELRKPEVKRGIAFLIEFVKNISTPDKININKN
ncbi:MAG: DUF1641 domain-containing protein [Candidatus Kryptoniota bacterium]